MTRGIFVGLLCSLAAIGTVEANTYESGTFQAHVLLVADSSDRPVSEPGAIQLLNEMTQAMKKTDYAGTYVHLRGDQIDTTKLWHRATAKGEQERLQTMSGEPREVIRHGNHCECEWPLRKEVVFGDFPSVRSRLSGARFDHPETLDANYHIVNLGLSRVADHACHLVGLVPRDQFRYGYKLCIDNESRLLLRMSIYNDQGRPIEHDFFTEIHFRPQGDATPSQDWPDIPMDTPQTIPPGYKVVERGQSQPAEPLQPEQGWIVSPDLPGYTTKSRVWRINPVTGHRFEHMVVTDGLSTASVFVEDMPQPKALDPDAAKYGMNIAVRQVGPVRLTVIGDLPMAAVEQICKHTVLAKDANTERGERNPMQTPNQEAR